MNNLGGAISQKWTKANPLGLNESLLAMKAYAPYHHLYAISAFISLLNNASDKVPNPYAACEALTSTNQMDQAVNIAGICLNSALEAAANEPQGVNRVFSPQNWIKAKGCLAGIRAAVHQYITMLPFLPGGPDLLKSMRNALALSKDSFADRWYAD
ncbi:MAG: hypothetical protein LBU64_09135 [Planctomycetota bacterium]|nr:hypothetical protein [Planctomycetota bacterium]